MSVADRRAKAAELGVSLSDFKAGIWKDKHRTNSSGGGKNYTQDELKDLFPAPPGSGPLPDTPIVGPVQPSPSPSPTPYVPATPVVQPVQPTTSTDTHKGDEKSSPFQSSFVRNYVGFENPYPTPMLQPTNPGTQPQPGTGGGVGPAPGTNVTITCPKPQLPTGNTAPGTDLIKEPPKPTGGVKDMPKAVPGTNGTSFTPYSSTDYFNKYGTPAISQQMYINDPYEGSKGQGFYGAAQFTPTNPFTGEPYKLGSDGLPDYGNLYSQGTYLTGQMLPTKKK